LKAHSTQYPAQTIRLRRNYNTANAAGAVSGNLAFEAFLTGARVPPGPEEGGWKDTLKILPFEVTTVAIRWAPTATAVNQVLRRAP
jgi:hypothetical protein